MSIFSRLFRKEIHRAAQEFLRNKVYRALYGLGIKFTQYDNKAETYIDEGYNANSDVYAVVSQKATEVQRIPFMIKSVKDKHMKERYKQFNRMIKNVLTPQYAIKKAIHESKAFEEKELPMPLEQPNHYQTWVEMWGLYETFMDTVGNAYFYLRSPDDGMNAGIPIEIYLLPSQLIQIVLKDNVDLLTEEQPIDYYMLTVGSQFVKFDYDDVVHVRYPNPNYDLAGSHLYGQSPLRAALTNIQSSNSAARLNARTLANGGSFGFLSSKEPLTPDQAEGLKDRLIEMDNSEERLSNIAGSSKEVVFTRISLTTDELKPFDYLEYDQKAISNVLHWDDKLLNSDDGAKYDNYKVALRRAITSGVSPNLRLLETAFNTQILPRFGGEEVELLFDESQLPEMQEDMEKLTKWLNDALDRGVISRDEYRLAINYTELGTPEMTAHTVGMNTMLLQEAISPPEGNTFD